MFQIARVTRTRISARLIALGLLGIALESSSACSTSSAPAPGGSPGPDAGPGGNGGDGGGPGTDGGVGAGTPLGFVVVSQAVTGSVASFDIDAVFLSSPVALPAGCTTTPVAGCLAIRCPDVTPQLPDQTTLNAGTLTVTGTGVSSPATLTYGPGPTPGINGYSTVTALTKFYNSGDTLSVSGAGGADLPSFPAQTLVAPNEIALTAPACASALDGGACTDVDRSTDARLAWTGGGAGQVTITYLTGSDSGTNTLSCVFEALPGAGVVPSAALMMLDPASAPGYYGQEFINPVSSKTFMVGTLAAVFTVQGTPVTGTFTTTH